MRALITDDGRVSVVDGFAAGERVVDVPEELIQIARSEQRRLVWTGSRIEDAASVSVWFVAPDGTRRAFRGGSDWQQVTGAWDASLVRADGGGWALQSASARRKTELYAYAAKRRWLHEASGVTVAGLSVSTDERTRAVLTAAFARAKSDATYSISAWRIGPGQYASLSNAQIIEIAEASAAHIQACFDLNASVDAKIASGEITGETQIDALFAAI